MNLSRQRQDVGGEAAHRDRWLISYADLVTLLLALFIVMYAASDQERARQIAQSFSDQHDGGSGILPGGDALESIRTRVEREIRSNPMLEQRTRVRQGRDGLTISLSEAGFFAPGDATISQEALPVVDSLAELLEKNQAKVRIEGHTDSTPISTAQYRSNWELSTARASTVLARFIDLGLSPERLSAAGYGGFQPIADNSAGDGRALNRRVDVVVIDH